MPNLSIGKRGFKTKVPLSEVVELIFYRLKTGCQWRELPMKQYVSHGKLSWQSVFYYFNKWGKDGSWKKVWIELLITHRSHLDLSSIQLDGSHTPSKKGGESVGYQGRKAANTSNSLFLADNTGQMLTIAEPQEGQRHDLFEIKRLFLDMCDLLKEAEISTKGLFLNADAGFDSKELRKVCESQEIEANIMPNRRNNKTIDDHYQYFDDELYKRRTVIEHANAWLDSYKALLVRFEKLTRNWKALHFMAFSVLFLRKIAKAKKV